MKKLGQIVLGILAILAVIVGLLYVISPDVTEVHIETEIDAPAAEVWAVLAHQFGDIAEWSSTVSESVALDASDAPDEFAVVSHAPVPGRRTVSPAGAFREFIIDYSEEDMTLTFQADGLPSIITKMTDTQKVIPLDDNRSLLTFDVSMEASGIFKALGPILSGRFASTFGLVQEELKVFVETGAVAHSQNK